MNMAQEISACDFAKCEKNKALENAIKLVREIAVSDMHVQLKASQTQLDERPEKTIKGRWVLGDYIEKGAFGTVYHAVDRLTSKNVVVKIESKRIKCPYLEWEHYVYRRLHQNCPGIVGFARASYFGELNDENVLVMDHVGYSLENYLKRKGPLALNSVLRVAINVQNRLQYMHESGFIHRDLKPANIMIDGKRQTLVTLIDFGLSKQYRKPNGTHIPFRKGKGAAGTPLFMSCNAHRGSELARRDDLESLVYVIVFLASGVLPWVFCDGSNRREVMDNIFATKLLCKEGELFDGMVPQIEQYYRYVTSLHHSERPDYDMLRGLLNSGIAELERERK